jgi:hypothetical protein
MWLFPEFLKQVTRLERSDAAFAKDIAVTLDLHLHDLSHPSLNFERITSATAPRMGSSRVGRALRLIHQEVADDALAMLNVGNHDAMYRWAHRYSGDATHRVRRARHHVPAAPAASAHGLHADDDPSWPRRPGVETFAIIGADDLHHQGFAPALVASIRAAPVTDHLAGLRLSEEQREIVRICYLYALRRAEPMPEAAPLPIPREDPEAPIPVASGHEFERMVDLGLDRYLTTLSPEQRRCVQMESRGLLLFKGAAGTGKTSIAVHRLKRYAEQLGLFEDRRVLYLCFNRVLAAIVPQMLQTLYGGSPPPTIEATTLDSWCAAYLHRHGLLFSQGNLVQNGDRYRQLFRKLWWERHSAQPAFRTAIPFRF